MLWKNLTLVIEYEKEDSTCWKTVCNEENVAYSCLKLHPLPLKSLREIKCLPLQKEPFSSILNESSKMPVFVSSSVYSKYNFLSSMEEKQNVCLFERSYSEYFPHIHFSDVTVSQTAGLIIVSMILFLNGDFLDSILDRLLGLHLKYEVCWIIMHDNLLHKNLSDESLIKIHNGYYKFYCLSMNMKTLQSFKIKFLYAQNEEEIIKWINKIISKNLKITFNKHDSYPKNLSSEMSQEELFLVSCPSLNPVVAAFIRSEKISLHELMNLKFEELCSKFYDIPERFLMHFHQHIQAVSLNSNPFAIRKEKIFESVQNSSQNLSRSSKYREFQLQSNPACEELNKFIGCLEKYKTNEDDFSDDFDLESSPTSDCHSQPCNIQAEMSVEEIDRNYRALQLQDFASVSFDVDFEKSSCDVSITSCKLNNSSFMFSSQSNLHSPPQKRRKHFFNIPILKDNVNYEEIKTCSLINKSCNVLNTNQASKYPLIPDLGSQLKRNSHEMDLPVEPEMKHCVSLYDEEEKLNSHKSAPRELNLSQYIHKSKRKLPPDLLNHNKYLKLYSQSSVLSNSPRIQKGQSSKTVCKKSWFENIRETQKVEISESSSQVFQSPSFTERSFQLQLFGKELDDPSDTRCIGNLDSFGMSQGSMTLTPRQSHRLSYERIPGKKGQTRLVFQ